MKKIGLFIVTLFFCMTTVEAKIYSSYNIGDEVKLNEGTDTTSIWRVIEASNKEINSIKILKEYNIENNIPFDTNGINDYSKSTIKKKVDTYGENLQLGDNLFNISLITLEELKSLGCTSSSCSKAPSWVYRVSYWTSSPKTELSNYVYRVGYNGNILGAAVHDTFYGIRPLMVVSKDVVLNGYINEEKNFDEINISCNQNPTGKEEFKCYLKLDKRVRSLNFDLQIDGLELLDSYNITNESWNETLTIPAGNNTFKIDNIALTKEHNLTDADILLKITGKVKDLKEDGKLTIKLTNLSMYDEYGDYQNISEATQKIKIIKTTKAQNLVENPNTGIKNITIVLLVILIILSLSIIISIIVKNNKNKVNKQ